MPIVNRPKTALEVLEGQIAWITSRRVRLNNEHDTLTEQVAQIDDEIAALDLQLNSIVEACAVLAA